MTVDCYEAVGVQTSIDAKVDTCMGVLEQAEDETQMKDSIYKMLQSDNVGSSIARKVLCKIGLDLTSGIFSVEFLNFVLSAVENKDQFEDVSMLFALGKSKTLVDEGDFTEALNCLTALKLDTIKDELIDTKFEVLMDIGRLYLKLDRSADCYRVLQGQARSLIRQVKNESHITTFKWCEARCLDHSRKYVEAASLYIQMSYNEKITEDERMTGLKRSINCSILGPVGDRRTFQLATLYKDERCRVLTSFSILEKVYLGRMISTVEKKQFAEGLEPHHLALTSDASLTILDRALIEHNMFAITKIYRNIRISQLGLILGIDQDKAEDICANMIVQNQIFGKIDQIEEVIHFTTEKEVLMWDTTINKKCSHLNNILNKIGEAHPDFLIKSGSQI